MTDYENGAKAMREAAAKVAHKRVNGFHHENCERGHIEWDTNAFVCSNRLGCLCDERTEEAEAIELSIRSLPIPTPSVTLTGADFTEPGPVVDAPFHAGLGILHSAPAPDPRDEALRIARGALEPFASMYGWEFTTENYRRAHDALTSIDSALTKDAKG